jgi:NAD+ kinase
MRILVVYKKSFLESHGAERRRVAGLAPADRDRLVRADRENRRALGDVLAHLARLGIPADAVFRGSLARRRKYDLVVSLGGDGTFFAAARHVRGIPILGINSDPSNSLGIWTCADRSSFPRLLARALEGTLPGTELRRLEIAVNGRPLREQAFNDVLFAHRNPAAMTRYRLTADRRTEDQRGSGLWIATAAGSTAGIRSAGGVRMPIGSRRIQFLAREPYTWPKARYALARGTADRLAIVPLTVDCAVWIDGSRVRRDLSLGDRVEIRPGDPLVVLGYDDRRRRRLFP